MSEPVTTARTRSSRGRALVVGAVVTLVAVAVPVGLMLVDDDRDRAAQQTHENGDTVARRTVLAALEATVASGSYDLRSELHVEPAAAPARACDDLRSPPSAATGTCVAIVARPVDVRSHGTVNLGPYRLMAVSDVTGLGSITIYADDTTVWEIGGGNYGAVGGAPLSGFASLVEGTLGPGQGSLAMISIASPNGYLTLEREALVGAQQSGTGTVDGAAVTYYDVTVNVSGMADAPDLTPEQRATIERAVAVLKHAGYTGTDERLGIDEKRYIREVTATTRFADGSSLTRHTVFSNFGCAPEIALPGEPAPEPRTGPCTTPAAPTTTTAPVSTSLAPTTTTISPATTTAVPTAPAPSTLPPTTTTTTATSTPPTTTEP